MLIDSTDLFLEISRIQSLLLSLKRYSFYLTLVL